MQNRYLGRNTDWEAEIKAAFSELALHGHEMSEYERNVISREIRKRQDELIPVVGAQVIGEFKGAIKNYQDALVKVDAERTKEINRFDSAKFNTELQAITTRVNLAFQGDVNELRGDKPKSDRLAAIYSEAMQSGDIHKQRAAFEVIKALPITGDLQERMKINQLAKDAEAAEFTFRQTEGTLKAQQERTAALNDLGAKQEKLNKVSEVLGMGSIHDPLASSPFAMAARQVEWPRDTGKGERISNEPIIHNENDPEVTRVYMSPKNEMST